MSFSPRQKPRVRCDILLEVAEDTSEDEEWHPLDDEFDLWQEVKEDACSVSGST